MFRLLSANQNPPISRVHHRRRQSVLPRLHCGNPSHWTIPRLYYYYRNCYTTIHQFFAAQSSQQIIQLRLRERGENKKKGHRAIDLVLRDGDGDGRGPLRCGGGRRRGRQARVEVPVPEGRGGVRARVVVVGAALVEVERVAQRVVPELPRGRAPPPPPRPLGPGAAPAAEAAAHRGPQPVPKLRRGRRRRRVHGSRRQCLADGYPPLSLSIGRLALPWESARADGCLLPAAIGKMMKKKKRGDALRCEV